jgi:protein-L-isoaspartate(D-aspartate) O-methyltransferase
MNSQEIRRKYAETLRASADLRAEAIMEAFAGVPCEGFLGPPPWQIGHAQPFEPAAPHHVTPDAGLEDIYQDVAMSIDPARQINNGQPSAHARWLQAVSPRPGESVLHIGCSMRGEVTRRTPGALCFGLRLRVAFPRRRATRHG